MRRTKLYSIVALLGAASALPSAASAQGLRDVRAIKPAMMLLVDTSGSMEYRRDEGPAVNRLPTCTNTAADEAQKNRWAVTLEALTGTFSNFRCTRKERSSYSGEFDQDYFLPHFDFTTGATQVNDGVLDAFKNRLKFGLMTFDGVLTTVGGDTLVDFTEFGNNSTFRNQVLGRPGMNSYPDTAEDGLGGGYGWMQLYFKGCGNPRGVNAGARGKGTDPGSLISVGLSDSSSDVQTVNQKIQESLLKVRPYGGTPIAGMLDDLDYYLQNDTDIKKNSDPYYECRQRYAIMLTDGAPDQLFRGAPFFCDAEEGNCPYDKEVDIATRLKQHGLNKLWVVAFNVNDEKAMSTLDAIALEGSGRKALSADTPNQLRDALTELMNIAQPDSTSRSIPMVVNTGIPVLLGGKQFEIIAGFRVGQFEDEPWQGTLLRRRVTCNNSTPEPQEFKDSEGDMFHLELDRRSKKKDRKIQTVYAKPQTLGLSAMRGNLYGADSNAIDNSAFTIAGQPLKLNTVCPSSTCSTYAETDTTSNSEQARVDNDVALSAFNETMPAVYFGDANNNNVPAEAADVKVIHDYLHGLSAKRVTRTLGDIYHSNPAVLPPLKIGSEHLNSFDPNLRAFYGEVLKKYDAEGRPGVVFVGTNDGILHAFNLDTWKKGTTTHVPGDELWGFVPPALFDKMAAMVAPSHQIMFDGTPVVRDVVLKRTPKSTAAPTMATVLVSAVRGAPAYIALDVTQAESPKFLWQRSFNYLGNTVATPAIGHVQVDWSGSGEQIRAVAILPGGEGELNTSTPACNVDVNGRGKATGGRDQVRCWKRRGRALYVVDIATGELLQEFDGRHFPSPLTGAVAVDSEGLALTRAAYFTDEDGVLWRLSMMQANPSGWRVEPIYDLFAGQAVGFDGNVASVPAPTYSAGRVATSPPLLTRDRATGNFTILVGTGDVDDLTDTTPHRVVSLLEKRTMRSGEIGGTVEKNWLLQLDRGESVTGPLVVFDDTFYFASFKGPSDSDDLCEMGTSRIVGGHVYKTAGGLPEPKLVPANPASADQRVLSYFPEDATNSLLLGLSIARDPVCMVGQRDPAYSTVDRYQQTGVAGGGGYTLHSMVAGQGSSSETRTQMKGTDLRQLTRSLPIPNIVRSVGWASSME
jgi:type IV pilus assembly protein PilY1